MENLWDCGEQSACLANNFGTNTSYSSDSAREELNVHAVDYLSVSDEVRGRQ